MTTPSASRKSSSDAARDRASMRDVLPGVALLVVTQASLLVLDPDGGASLPNLLWALAPLAPAGWLVWAQLRSLRRADEYQRIGQLEAMAVGFGAMVLVALAGGLLDGAGLGDPRQSLQVTFAVGVLSWLAVGAVKAWLAR